VIFLFFSLLSGKQHSLQIVGQTHTYNVYLSTMEAKTQLLRSLKSAINECISSQNRLREIRIKAGIEMIVDSLQQVMPLISKEWMNTTTTPRGLSGETLETHIQGITELFSKVRSFPP